MLTMNMKINDLLAAHRGNVPDKLSTEAVGKAPYRGRFLFSVLILTLVCQAGWLAAQPDLLWEKSLGGSQTDFPSGIRLTADGGTVVFGTSTSSDGDVGTGHASGDFWVARLDTARNIVWQKSFGGSQGELSANLLITPDSSIVLVGSTDSNDGDVTGGYGGGDYWVVKLDLNGNLLWQKALGGQRFDAATDVAPAPDGGLIVSGYTMSGDGQVTGHHGEEDFWLVKLDALGNLVWQKTYGGTGSEAANSIAPTQDGGFLVAGLATVSNSDVTSTKGQGDFWVIKIDGAGNLVWQKIFGGSGYDQATSIGACSDGNFIVTGFTGSNDGDVAINRGLTDYLAIKISPDGNLVWARTFGGTATDFPARVAPANDGGAFIVGYTTSVDGQVTDNHGQADGWVVRVDQAGGMVWQKAVGGSLVDQGLAGAATADGGVILASYSNSSDGDVSGNKGGADLWLVKLGNESGMPVNLISFEVKVNPKGTVDVSWRTSEETNNAYFEVEKSKDAQSVLTVARLMADSTSDGMRSYRLTDETPFKGTSYYRLKQVDIDGRTTLYNWHVAVIERHYTIFPNPASDGRFTLVHDEPETARIELFSAKGERIHLQRVKSGDASSDLRFQHSASVGVLSVKVHERGQTRIYKLVTE